jgi:hypothetical protein
MPGMPVERFVSSLRSTLVWANVPVILTTAAWEREIPSGLSVDAVLLRPFEVQPFSTWSAMSIARALQAAMRMLPDAAA